AARPERARTLQDMERADPTLQAEPRGIGRPLDATKAASDATKPGKKATQQAKTVTSAPENATATPKDATQSAGESSAADPVVQVADEILSRIEDMRISTGAMDADG